MFTSLKKGLVGIAAVGALAFAASQAQAANIGGINLSAGANIKVGNVFENQITNPGDPLGGYGEVAFVNGTTDFCAGGAPGSCELTFRFGGYSVKHISPTEVVFTGGWVNFYVDQTPDFQIPGAASDAAAIAAATDGDLWLTLAGHTSAYPTSGFGAGTTGTLQGLGSILGAVIAGFGSGLLDVDYTGAANGNSAGAGASANAFFDTDSYSDLLGGTADVSLDTSFTSNNVPFTNCNGGPGCLQGSATVNANIIPEPGTLSILGLGLLGLAAVRRRRQVA